MSKSRLNRPGFVALWTVGGLMALLATGVVADRATATQESPYVGMTQRPVKALSENQIEDYLSGRGMGFALAAELNGYPGPMHVLELAGELQLTDEQLAAVQMVFDRMLGEAVELGERIVAAERELDRLFADGEIDAERLSASTEAVGLLNGKLRGVHLAAHLATVDILSEHQRHQYMMARGYDGMDGHDPSRHH